MTLTLPSVSTLGSFLTMALRFDMRRTPSASVTVTTMGKPSGMAATASDTASGQARVSLGVRRHANEERGNAPPMVNISSQLRFCRTPMRQMTPMTPNEMADNRLASSSMAICSGVFLSPTCRRAKREGGESKSQPRGPSGGQSPTARTRERERARDAPPASC